MTKIQVKEIDHKYGCEHITIFSFFLPDVGEDGFYRETVSFNAFFLSVHRRNRSPRYLYHFMDFRDGDHRSEWELERDALLPTSEHGNIYQFFKAIGYDKDKKKYR